MDVYVCKIKENGKFKNACVFDNIDQANIFIQTNEEYYDGVEYEIFSLIESTKDECEKFSINMKVKSCEDCPNCKKDNGITCDGFPDSLSDTYYCNQGGVFKNFKFKPDFIFYGCPFKKKFTIDEINKSRNFEAKQAERYYNSSDEVIKICDKYNKIINNIINKG